MLLLAFLRWETSIAEIPGSVSEQVAFLKAIPGGLIPIIVYTLIGIIFLLLAMGPTRLAESYSKLSAIRTQATPRPRTARAVSTQDVAVGEADPPPQQAAYDGRKALCLHLADELEQEHERYENEEQKIASWAAGLGGSGISEDEFDQQVANLQYENFARTLNRYSEDLKGRLLDLYGTLEPQGWLGGGDRSRIVSLNDPYHMLDLAKRLRRICGKLSGDIDALRTDDAEAENKRLAAQLHDKAKRKAVKDLLGAAVEQGESLRGEMRKVGNDFRFNTKADVERWVHKTHDFIEAAFDKGEARHFLDSGDYAPKNPLAVEEMPEVDTYEYHLEPRLRRLQELIVRANESEINHDFDPQYWIDRFNPE